MDKEKESLPRLRSFFGCKADSAAASSRYFMHSGMTRDHPFANTPRGQHPLPRSGLAVVAHARKYSHSPVSILILPQ
jgi:hypothetical protein